MAETRRETASPPPARPTSSGLALASVTAILKRIIENGLARRAVTSLIGGDAIISSLPPDRIPSGSDEKAQLNVFLFTVSPHSALSTKRNGGPPPLSLDLHYLISGYGAQDFQAEILLGIAIQILHEKPVVEREELRTILRSLSSAADRRVVPPTSAALASSDLADRTARMSITPEFLSTEDSSKLWSAMQAKYRPSATYKVTAIPVTTERMP